MVKDIEKIIEEFNAFLKEERMKQNIDNTSFVVFGATISQTVKFKAYKTLTYKLVLVNNESNTLIYSNDGTANFTSETDKNKMYNSLDRHILYFIFKLIGNNSAFTNILKGEWNETI